MKVGERKSERSPLFHLFGEEKGVKRELFGESGESFGERSPLFTPFGGKRVRDATLLSIFQFFTFAARI